jgi:outer membrane protein
VSERVFLGVIVASLLKRFCLAGVLLAGVPGHAAVLELTTAISAAELYDAQYLRAQSVFEQSSHMDDEARGALKPHLMLSHDQRYTEQEVLESENEVYRGGSSDFVSRTSMVRLEQVVYDRQAWQWYLRAGVEQKVFVQDLRAEYQNLLLRLAEGLLFQEMAAAELRLAKSDVDALERLALVQRARFEQGEVARVDFLDAQAGLDNARAKASEARQKVSELQRRVDMIVGERVELTMPLTQNWLAVDAPLALDDWWRRAEANSPQLIAAELRREMARLGHKSARAASLPKFYLSAEYNRDSKDDTLFGGGATIRGAAVYLRTQWDLYDGGSSIARARRASGELRTAELERELIGRDIKQLVDINLDKLAAGLDQIRGYRSAVVAASELASLRKIQLDGGTVDEFKYLQALRSSVQSQTSFSKAVGNYQLTVLRLLHAAGVLTPADLIKLQ